MGSMCTVIVSTLHSLVEFLWEGPLGGVNPNEGHNRSPYVQNILGLTSRIFRLRSSRGHMRLICKNIHFIINAVKANLWAYIQNYKHFFFHWN